MCCKFTSFFHPEIPPEIFVELLPCARPWEGALSTADLIPAIILLSYLLGRLQGTGEGGRRSTGASPTITPGSLQLSPGMGLEKLIENHGGTCLKLTEWYAGSADRQGGRALGKSGKNTHR